jgi:hypothetical protein
MEVFLIVAGSSALIALGAFLYFSLGAKGTTLTPNNTGSTDCDLLCDQIGTKSAERRNAEISEANARSALGVAIAADAAAALLAGAAWVVVVALASNFLTALGAAIAAIVAIALSAAALTTAGVVAAAIVDVANKSGVAARARDAEMQARTLFLEKCKNREKVDACLSRAGA